ncbi:MAG: hypothetical protein AAF577_04075 [Pseudomonadota bacterium]
MTGLVLVDVAIAILFLILVLSIVTSAIVEAFSSFLNWRGETLVLGMKKLIGEGFDDFWKQPLIEDQKGLAGNLLQRLTGRVKATAPGRAPSYLAPDLVAKELISWLGLSGKPPGEIKTTLADLAEGNGGSHEDKIRQHVAQRLLRVVTGAEEGIESIETAFAEWYDASITRISGVFRRHTRLALFWSGFVLSAALNLNVMSYAQLLLEDEALRNAQVAAAIEASEATDIATLREQLNLDLTVGETPDAEAIASLGEDLAALRTALDAVLQPEGHATSFGWEEEDLTLTALSTSVLSWLLLGFATTLGAQFWFDLLKSFVKVRATGRRLLPGGRDADASNS